MHLTSSPPSHFTEVWKCSLRASRGLYWKWPSCTLAQRSNSFAVKKNSAFGYSFFFFFSHNVQTYDIHTNLFRSLEQNEASPFPFDIFRIRSLIINLELGLISMFLSQFKASWVLLPKRQKRGNIRERAKTHSSEQRSQDFTESLSPVIKFGKNCD